MKEIEKSVAKENKESNDSSDNYEFVTETIKSRPINKRKAFKRVVTTIMLAILFGIVASLTLIFVYPILADRFLPSDDTKTVVVPVTDDEVSEEPVEEFVPPAEDEVDGNSVDEGRTDSGSQNEIVDSEVDSEEIEKLQEELEKVEAESDQVVINQVVEKTIEKDLELDDYRGLLRKISAIATNTQKSLVTVSGRRANTDWFNNSYVNNNSSTGVIIGENGKDLLIMSPTSILHAATVVDVTFNDGNTCRATIKVSDANTGLSIVAVPIENIEDATKAKIQMAEFGSISSTAVGMPIVAVGSPYGTAGSVGMGQITSNSIVVDKTDSNVRLISTDIYGSTSATGVIVNYSGRIVGIICHEDVVADMPNLIRAYAASDITDTIEKMSNNQKIASLGIIGTDVTKEANENLKVPYGTYVKEVVIDSPAMNEGIRNGDVIVKIGTKDIKGFDDYKSAILSMQPGEVVNVKIQRPDGSGYTEVAYEITLEELK